MELDFFLLIAVVNDCLDSRPSQISINDRPARPINQVRRLITAVFLHQWNLKLEVLALFLIGRTSLFFDSFEAGDVRVIVARYGLSAAQLAMQLKFIRFDRLAALAIVTIEPDVHHFTRIVLVFHEFDLALRLRTAEEAQSHIRSDLQFVVFMRNIDWSLVDLDATTAAEETHVPVFAGELRVVHVELFVSR